eukprot:gene21576-28574_t
MYSQKTFLKKTRKGKIQKKPSFLRSGTPLDPECDPSAHKLSVDCAHYLLIDTNVALHQLDFLEHAAVCDAIVCTVVLEEVKHKNMSAYQRLRNLNCLFNLTKRRLTDKRPTIPTVASQCYSIGPFDSDTQKDNKNHSTILTTQPSEPSGKIECDTAVTTSLTDDRAMSVQQYANTRTDCSELVDLVAASSAAHQDEAEEVNELKKDEADEGGLVVGQDEADKAKYRWASRRASTTKDLCGGRYKPAFEVGVIDSMASKILPADWSESHNPALWTGWVSSDSIGAEILLSGREAMNRTLDGENENNVRVQGALATNT